MENQPATLQYYMIVVYRARLRCQLSDPKEPWLLRGVTDEPTEEPRPSGHSGGAHIFSLSNAKVMSLHVTHICGQSARNLIT